MRYNESLKKRHESLRKQTIQVIQEAVEDIKGTEGDDAPITAKKLQDYTDLSRGTLYKEHVLKIWNYKLWEEKHVLRTKMEKDIKKKFDNDLKDYSEEIIRLNKELENANLKIRNLEEKLDKQKMRSTVYQDDIEELKIKNQKVLGECQRLYGRLKAHGISID